MWFPWKVVLKGAVADGEEQMWSGVDFISVLEGSLALTARLGNAIAFRIEAKLEESDVQQGDDWPA